MFKLHRNLQCLSTARLRGLYDKLKDFFRPYVAPPDTLCLFLSYVPDGDHSVDANLLRDLQRLFPNLIVLTNTAPANENFSWRVYENKGYDFGFWYQAMPDLDLGNYSRLVLINNSNYLVRSRSLSCTMRWGEGCGYDFWGLTDSHETPSGLEQGKCYHVQSHFMVMEKTAIRHFAEFLGKIDFPRFYQINDPVLLREAIINECEIGLTQYMLARGLRVGAKFPARKFIPSVSTLDWQSTNMHMMLWEELINAGYPLVKKKIPNKDWPFLQNIHRVNRYLSDL